MACIRATDALLESVLAENVLRDLVGGFRNGKSIPFPGAVFQAFRDEALRDASSGRTLRNA